MKTTKTSRSSKLETPIVRDIMEVLKPMGVAFKIHGGPMQAAGFPDILFWCQGLSFAFEVKRPEEKYKVTELQRITLEQMRDQGVEAWVVHSPLEAVTHIHAALEMRRAILNKENKNG